MICLDGFTLSHVYEIVEMPEQEKVDKYLPAYKPFVKLDPENPVTIGPVAFPDTFMEFKYEQQKAINNSAKIIEKANADFEKIFGRSYGNGLLDLYRMEDAEYAIIGMGTLCGTARKTVDKLREQNKKVGLIKIRSYRPFPAEQLIKAAKNLKGIAVIDRHISLGNNGPLFEEVSAVYGNAKDIFVNGFIAGLGGRDITIEHLNKALEMTMKRKMGCGYFEPAKCRNGMIRQCLRKNSLFRAQGLRRMRCNNFAKAYYESCRKGYNNSECNRLHGGCFNTIP